MDILSIWNAVWPILIAIVVFCLIITIHEFGHFIFAKLFKVRVNEFAVGFGPAIFKKKHGETLYALRIFPIGGYCAMEGEDEQSGDERVDPGVPVKEGIDAVREHGLPVARGLHIVHR